ncbi:MAG: hypothetical protein Q8O30_05555 [Candidatus Omnitrophota bacterium]|nr:hypothetical protein [Candidatus Omnitrophota bacterium]
MKKKINDFPFNCPICNSEIFGQGQLNFRACPHVIFFYTWGSDLSGFSYVNKNFAGRYIAKLKNSDKYKKHLEAHEITDNIDNEMQFATGSFSPFNQEVINNIPYFEDLAMSSCPEDTMLYILDSYYSGFSVCIGEGI